MRCKVFIIFVLSNGFVMKRYICVLLIAVISSVLWADEYEDYVSKYKDIAIREMYDYGIPASITLAQGILESGLGKSELAVKANNHFGIKCHNEWSGDVMYHDDDAKGECFRKYKSAEESYIDHSQILKNKARYSFLFELDRTDYKGWAKGLKQAGYATDRNYAKRLITLIEEHNLHLYDSMYPKKYPDKKAPKKSMELNVKHIFAGENETYHTIAKKYHIPFGLIYLYNDVDRNSRQPKTGDVVFLQMKKNSCEAFDTHTVQKGESMHYISQKYGIRLLKLYDMNDMPHNMVPKVGQILKLK